MKRVVSSTLATETQRLLNGLGHAEWIAHLAEMLCSSFAVDQRSEALRRIRQQSVVDAQSLYDHLVSLFSPSSVHDTKCFFDLVIAKQCMTRVEATIRWLLQTDSKPTRLQKIRQMRWIRCACVSEKVSNSYHQNKPCCFEQPKKENGENFNVSQTVANTPSSSSPSSQASSHNRVSTSVCQLLLCLKTSLTISDCSVRKY